MERLLEVLAGDRHAPTSVSDPVPSVDVHIADSLSALEVDGFRTLERIVDIGSGAGFPGLVLAAAMPETDFDLLESSRRKCAYLKRAAAALDVSNVQIVRGRAEQWAAGGGAEGYSGAVVRAVGALPTLVEYAAPLLRTGGRLVAWKARRDSGEERAGAVAAGLLGMRSLLVEVVVPFGGSRDRHLHVYEKVSHCPPGYPRRPGIAAKRPLGS